MVAIEIRNAVTDDLPFIFATWLRSYRHSSQFAKKISNDVYFKYHHAAIERIISRGGIIKIANIVGDPNVILGYACLEAQGGTDMVVHYVYVKKNFRKMGIASRLYKPEKGDYFTHLTDDVTWALAKYDGLIYNPYRL
jgi:hypothetical protein